MKVNNWLTGGGESHRSRTSLAMTSFDTMLEQKQKKYSVMVKVLELRYGDSHLSLLYKFSLVGITRSSKVATAD
jgi:hypothetical protein